MKKIISLSALMAGALCLTGMPAVAGDSGYAGCTGNSESEPAYVMRSCNVAGDTLKKPAPPRKMQPGQASYDPKTLAVSQSDYLKEALSLNKREYRKIHRYLYKVLKDRAPQQNSSSEKKKTKSSSSFPSGGGMNGGGMMMGGGPSGGGFGGGFGNNSSSGANAVSGNYSNAGDSGRSGGETDAQMRKKFEKMRNMADSLVLDDYDSALDARDDAFEKILSDKQFEKWLDLPDKGKYVMMPKRSPMAIMKSKMKKSSSSQNDMSEQMNSGMGGPGGGMGGPGGGMGGPGGGMGGGPGGF